MSLGISDQLGDVSVKRTVQVLQCIWNLGWMHVPYYSKGTVSWCVVSVVFVCWLIGNWALSSMALPRLQPGGQFLLIQLQDWPHWWPPRLLKTQTRREHQPLGTALVSMLFSVQNTSRRIRCLQSSRSPASTILRSAVSVCCTRTRR